MASENIARRNTLSHEAKWSKMERDFAVLGSKAFGREAA
jgi:hypothetical protein